MQAAELPSIGNLGVDDWPYLLAESPYGDGYSGAYSTSDGSRVQDITAERVARVDLAFGERGDYAEVDIALLVELTDGTWATCMAWADTTGWGCQDNVQWKVAPTRDQAISQGLDRDARRKLGVPLPGEEAVA